MYAYSNPSTQLLKYEDYYKQQAGNGISPHWFKGAQYQRGHGIGSFLGGLFRTALPLLKKGGIAVGKELFNAGSRVLGDIGEGTAPKEALKERLGESVSNLKRQATDKVFSFLRGEGYKIKRRRGKCQSKRKPQRKKSAVPARVKRRRNSTSNKKVRRIIRKKNQKRKNIRRTKQKKQKIQSLLKKKKVTRQRNKYNLVSQDIFN